MKIRNLFLVAAVVPLVACATRPESISPAYVSQMTYRDYTCEQLAEESTHLTRALYEAYGNQRQARTNDTVGVILLGLPVSSLSGDNVADQVARLKGEWEAVRTTGIKKKCNLGMESVDAMMAKDEKQDEAAEKKETAEAAPQPDASNASEEAVPEPKAPDASEEAVPEPVSAAAVEESAPEPETPESDKSQN